MGSKRLPGKTLKFLYNKSVIEHIIDRIERIDFVNKIIVGTTSNKEDDILCDFLKKKSVHFIRFEEENNLLGRFHLAIKEYPADFFLKINADCPIVDIDLVTEGIQHINKDNEYDIITNRKKKSFPLGLSYEIIRSKAVEICVNNNLSLSQKELFVDWMFENSDKFLVKNILSDVDYKDINLCLDTAKDYKVINKIFDVLWEKNNFFGLFELKKLFEINRKKYGFK